MYGSGQYGSRTETLLFCRRTRTPGLGALHKLHAQSLCCNRGVPRRAVQLPANDRQLARLRVLVVEDVRDTADTFALLIGALGHDTRVVRESPRVMSAAREFRPDVVFLDIGMPDIDGFELARMLRAQFGNPLWICAATGYG